MRHQPRRRGFTLVELLVVIGIVAVLIGLLLPTLDAVRKQSESVACLAQMRQIGQAMTVYVGQNDGLFPRSSHSAIANRTQSWGRAFMPLLGYGPFQPPTGGPRWPGLLNGLYRCPADDRSDLRLWSYGQSVYFELSTAETGGPTWHRVTQVRRPSRTVLYCEVNTSPGADHVMAHFWPVGSEPEVARDRHGSTQNYLFVDGHAQAMSFDQTYNPVRFIDLYNPASAR